MTDAGTAGDRSKAVLRMVDLLAQENSALKRLDFSAAIALVPAKEATLAVLANPPPAPLQQTALAHRLVCLAAENQMLLEQAISVQTRIVRIVARAAILPPAATSHYGGRPPCNRPGAVALSTRA